MVADEQLTSEGDQQPTPVEVPVPPLPPADAAPGDADALRLETRSNAGPEPVQASATSPEQPTSDAPAADAPVESSEAPVAPTETRASGEAVPCGRNEFRPTDVAPTETHAAGEAESVAEAPEPVSETPEPAGEELEKRWYILKVQVNREDSIRDAILRRIKVAGLDRYFGDIVVPTEDVAEFNKSGKRRIVRRKLYPGYILVHMAIDDESWFLVRETPGVGDFTGSAGKPTALEQSEVDRILRLGRPHEEGGAQIKTAIPFKAGDRVRVKDGNFQNYEGEVESIDEANGSITVMINIFNRSVPVELKHWQVETI